MVRLLRGGRRGLPIAALGIAPIFVLAAATLGLQLPTDGGVPSFAAPSGVDYSRGHLAFLPLRAEFLTSVLGASPGAPFDQSLRPGQPDRPFGGAPSIDVRPPIVVPALENDAFSHAYDVTYIPFTASEPNAGATRERNEPQSCERAAGTVWYRFTAPSDERLVADTFGSTYGTVLAVYEGSSFGHLSMVDSSHGCDSDGRGEAQVVFGARAGDTYYFQIAALAGGSGTLVFHLAQFGALEPAVFGFDGSGPNGSTFAWGISADGRYLAVWSWASNLVPGYEANCKLNSYTQDYGSRIGQPSCAQVYVRDRWAGTNTLVSASASGAPGDNESIIPAISGDGRSVAFASLADNLGAQNPNDNWTVLERDVPTGATWEPSGPRADGSFHPALSFNGRYVAFTTQSALDPRHDENRTRFDPLNPYGVLGKVGSGTGWDTYVYDRLTSREALAGVSSSGTQGDFNNGGPEADYHPSITPDGRYVVFASDSDNLIEGQKDENHATDVFVHDFATGRTTRVSVASDGEEAHGRSFLFLPGSTISADGRYVVFGSDAANLVPPGQRPEGIKGRTARIEPSVFVHDLLTGRTQLVSATPLGGPESPSEAFGGGNNIQDSAAISADGRFVVYSSRAQDLTPNQKTEAPHQNVFLFDALSERRIRLSINPESNQPANGDCGYPTISADGRFVVFYSHATNLVSGYRGYSGALIYRLPSIP